MQKSNYSYTVRSHAMQSYVRKKRSRTTENGESESVKGSKINTKSAGELSGKFKLASWSKKRAKKRSPEVIVQGGNLHDNQLALESQALMLYAVRGGHSFEIDRFDAYGTLPISMSSRTQKLFYHYNTAFTSNAFAINYDDTWKPYSVSDSALLHATLSLVAQHSDLLHGTGDSPDSLYHKGQALKLINSRLFNDKAFMSDANITTIVVLLSLEAISGTFEAATAHQAGLMKMVKLRGGPCSLNHNSALLRAMAWSDTMYSMRWATPIKFHTLFDYPVSLVSILSQDSNINIPTKYFTYPWSPETSDIFQSIQIISSSIDTPDLSLSSKKRLSETFYKVEHRLLFLEQSNYSSQEAKSMASPLYQAFIIAALLYLQIVIREIPAMSKVNHSLISKIQVFLTSVIWNNYDEAPYEDMLLWVILVANMSSPRDKLWDGFWLVQKENGLDWERTPKESVRKRMESIAWRNRICDPFLDKIWSSQQC